jgi:hypothetical protein
VIADPDDDSVKVTQLRIGPFIDWYPHPERGFHTVVLKGNPIEPAAFGAALATGSGYEWFVTAELSLGFIGRFAFGTAVRAASDNTEHIAFIVPELAVSATFH